MAQPFSCNIRQKQPGLFALRLRAVGGDLTATQIQAIATVAEQYGNGGIHITTRQGVEIHDVKKEDLTAAQAQLEASGLTMGADGNRVRIVIACPGNSTCRFGSIDTKSMAAKLDEHYFRVDTPYKVKMGVAGCPNNCGKAREADIGIMGSRIPQWNAADCIDCGACIKFCVHGAISKEGDTYQRDEAKCINCSACVGRCPKSSWETVSVGYTVLVGGTLGKRPMLGIPVAQHLETEEEALAVVDRVMNFYKEHGQPRERLGHLIQRLGHDTVRRAIL